MFKKHPYLLWILCSSAVCFFLGTLFHFLYQWFPCLLFRVLFPINESVWEHLKLSFYPVLIVWLIPTGKFPEKLHLPDFNLRERLTGATFSSIIGMLVVFFGYYGLKYGWSIEGLPSDLLLYAISLLLGQYHGTVAATNKKFSEAYQLWIYLLIIIAVLFMLFSLAPLNFPAFVPPY